MIDVLCENLITLREAARLPAFKRNGRAPHLASIHRWAAIGVRGTRLETVRQPGGMATSVEAVARFLHALTYGPSPPVPTTATIRRQQAQVDRQLAEAGIG